MPDPHSTALSWYAPHPVRGAQFCDESIWIWNLFLDGIIDIKSFKLRTLYVCKRLTFTELQNRTMTMLRRCVSGSRSCVKHTSFHDDLRVIRYPNDSVETEASRTSAHTHTRRLFAFIAAMSSTVFLMEFYIHIFIITLHTYTNAKSIRVIEHFA